MMEDRTLLEFVRELDTSTRDGRYMHRNVDFATEAQTWE